MSQNFTQGTVFSGNMVFDPSNMSGFGTLETAELTPVFQGDFVFGLNTQLWNTPVVSGTGAAVDTDAGRLRIQCGTNSAGYAYITSKLPLRYRAGQGQVIRITPLYSAGIANNIQLWGAGALESNVPYDGYFFGFNGTAFGVCHYVRGSATWTAQTAWNGDKCLTGDGSFIYDPTKGTPAMIKYPYLGFGNIGFYLQNPVTSRWVLVHTIQYANSVATTQLSNPTLQLMGFTLNSGNTTNKTMYSGSVGAFISGYRSFVGNPRWSAKNNKSSITTETNILALRNSSTYNTVTNRGMLRLMNISVSSSAATGIATVDIILNPTLGGTPAYTPRNGSTADNGVTITSGNSIASFDTAGTTITGGLRVFSVTVDNPNSQSIDMTPYDLFIAPAEIVAFAGTSSNASQIGVSANWSEDI